MINHQFTLNNYLYSNAHSNLCKVTQGKLISQEKETTCWEYLDNRGG